MDGYDGLLNMRDDMELLRIDHHITDMESLSHMIEGGYIEFEGIDDISWETLHFERIERLVDLTSFDHCRRGSDELHRDFYLYLSLHIDGEKIHMEGLSRHWMFLKFLDENGIGFLLDIQGEDMILTDLSKEADKFRSTYLNTGRRDILAVDNCWDDSAFASLTSGHCTDLCFESMHSIKVKSKKK